MVTKRSRVILVITLVFATILLSQGVVAQNYWMRPTDQRSVSLDFFKASYDHGEALGFFTSIVCLSAYIPATPRLAVIFDLPVVNADIKSEYEYPPYWVDQTLIGNPYLGIEYVAPLSGGGQAVKARFGFRSPLASDEKWYATDIGYVMLIDRFEAFMPELWTLSGGFGYKYTTEIDFSAEVDFTGDLMIPTEGGGDPELFIDYNLGLWYRPQMARLGFGFAGRMLATEDDLDFGERTVHQFGFFGGYDFGMFEPGFHFRIPLGEDLTGVLNFVWGVNLTATFE